MKKTVVSLIVGLFCWNALAQTAGQDVTNGLNYLASQDLVNANAQFTNALALSPTNEDANVLVAATRLLLLPTQPAGSNFLNGLGFTNTGRNVFQWTSTLPVDSNGSTVLPSENTSVMISFYRTTVMAALGASRTNLAMITDTNFSLSLTTNETSLGAVTLDYGDVLLLQALERVAEFAGYTLNAQNFDVVLSQLQALGKNGGLSIQQVLSLYPSLLTQSSASDLAASKGALTNAIALYLAASDFIRNDRAPDAQSLFNLSPDETNNEALFRTELTNVLLSLNQPVQFNTNAAYSLYAGAYFAGARSPRSLVPQFNGDRYLYNTLPDYTFGGILVGEPACDTEALLRNLLDRPYPGIYTGTLADSFNGGAFAAFLGANLQATIVGYDQDIGSGAFVQFSVDNGGSWSFETNGASDSGAFIVSANGSFGKDGSFNGEFDYFDTNFNYMFSQYLNGNLSSPLGNFQSSAGNYSGNWSGGGQSGQLKAVLSADGQVYFCEFESTGVLGDGGSGQIDLNNHFIGQSVNGTVVAGTLNGTTLSGNFTNGATSGTFSFGRSANVPFDVPPAITTPPSNKIAPLGTNATFSVLATGSAPMCYQWYFNSNAIPFATTNTLVVSNLQYSSAGTYSVEIDNVAGETNASATLTVVPETIPPTIQITAPTPGLQVSNANYTVTGKAADNVGVSNVFYRLNNNGWNPVTSFDGSNWTAAVTLVAGTNTIAAYAVDTSGNVSTTNTVIFDCVVSAPLTVQLTGTGTISPNYSNAVLQVGTSYSMTAGVVAGSGFAFANWTGGTNLPLTLLTNGPTLQFVMASNLVLQANFVDTNRPVVSITNVTAGQQISNANFTVKGTATDNVAVASVYFRLNTTGWSNATSFNGTSWTAAVTLSPGTNTIAIYAVDPSGNVSTTNSVSFQYVVAAPLTVQLAGLGTVSPNYSNAVLAVGQNYGITASPGSGFMFTNWTGGTNLPLTLLTNGTTLQFLMQSNLVLQANFVDTSKPVLSITNLTSGQQVSNVTFTVKGTAADNWMVSNVWCQINGLGWNLATNINNWTNWAAGVTLTPGTNLFQAYAVDTTGNLSTTNSVSFQYVVAAPLTVQLAGLGTVSPNYSNAVLAVGQNYGITASPGSGFMFTNWTGGTNLPLTLLTNGTTLQFLMQSNLTLQANFVDTSKPVLSITNLTSGQQVSNVTFTVKGTAADNWMVSNVWCQINGLGWNLATNINNWTNWAAGVTLTPGTNLFQAYAVDTTGNLSTTNSVSFQYVVAAPLTVQLAGLGTVSPNYSNAVLAVGQNYGITASPGSGFMFTNWTGGTNLPLTLLTNGTTLQFLMQSNLVLQANFVDTSKPVLSITNLTSGQQVSNVTFTVKGTAADNWMVSNVWCQINGLGWNLATNINNWTNWAAGVTLTPGTNLFQAYAVDTTGNLSTTNSVSFQYVVAAPLTVQLAGLGTVSPNYSNAVLAVGQNYGITASPGSGFMFTNWTGGTNLPLTLLTNGTTLQFLMQSNLVLQANFVDTSKPVLSITNLTSGQQVSNVTFTVKGTAADNWMVSNVWCQINGLGWNLATNINNWTNWAAGVTLTPGTNLFQAYAVDTTGNLSTTNSVSFQYVVAAPLTVQLAGLGTVSPNYSNAVLAVGQNYGITASPGSGFMFTNWTGGTNLPLTLLTNGTTLQFLMQSNLVLQANFVDTSKPVLSITNLTSGQQVSNVTFTVKGTAADNWMVSNVWCQINGLGWNLATNINNWTNWAAGVTLSPGTNLFQAYAVDTTGNLSTTNSVSFQYVVAAPLTVQLAGLGTVSPNYSNAVLAVGQNYGITASPGSGFMFTNWTGGTNLPLTLLTNGTTLQFLMQSNLVLQANFVDVTKPTLTITAPTPGQHMTNALATVTGTASDNWKVTGVWYQLNTGTWSQPTTTNNWTNWTTAVKLQNATNTIKAYALDLGGNFSTTNNVSFVSSNAFVLQLVFTVAQPLATNGLSFALQTSPGLNGHVQVSTDLVDWLTLTNFVGTNSTLNFLDPAATNMSLRFYRAVIP